MKYHCGQKGIDLTRREIELHHCLAREKGRNKGKRCRYLVELFVK
jgi:hypothetical protein